MRDEFNSEDLATALQFMKQERARTGADPTWESAEQHALAVRGLSRYGKGIEQRDNSTDVPGQVAPTVLERLGVRLQPVAPWLRRIIEVGPESRSFSTDELFAIQTYAKKHLMTPEEAARALGIKGLPLPAPSEIP
jgi:hypothetical protein